MKFDKHNTFTATVPVAVSLFKKITTALKQHNRTYMIRWLPAVLLFAGTMTTQGQDLNEAIRLNQVGFYPSGQKVAAVINASDTGFIIREQSSGDTVYSGSLSPAETWAASGEDVRLADFSDFHQLGTYELVVPGMGRSHPFNIGENALKEAGRGALRYYYYNRCSMAITEAHGGQWARPAGHPDTSVEVHSSAASDSRPEGTFIESSKGWYDAGDFGKYSLTAGISTYTLLSAYEQFPAYTRSLDLNIPESNDSLPDILNEVLWELRWWFTMQDTGSGGVYHKLTALDFAGTVMPHEDSAQRYVCGMNTNASLDFAATMAAAYRIFKPYEDQLPGFADSCLSAAEKAWGWAEENPNVGASQCPDFETGGYGDSDPSDEFDWAAAELYLATGEESYYNARDLTSGDISAPSWPNKRALGIVSLLVNADSLSGTPLNERPELESQLQTLADSYLSYQSNSSPYRIVMGHEDGNWVWGSNGTAGNQAFMLITAYNYFGNEDYLSAARSNIDYLLGRNATTYSFVTGYGDKTPMHPHHRASEADSVTEPVPGMVVGGPFQTNTDDCFEYPSDQTAKRYTDEHCSYSTNEVTVNWNAPYAFSSVALQALYDKRCQSPRLGEDIALCATDTSFPLTLNAKVSGGDFSWYKNGALIDTANGPALSLDSAGSAAGSYKVIRDSAACVKSDSISISGQIDGDTCICTEADTADTDGDGVTDCYDECPGDPGARIDSCGRCVGGTSGLEPCEQDCNNEWGGTAFIDSCDVCAGGSTGVSPVLDPDSCGPVGVIAQELKQRLSIYPNPSHNSFVIQLKDRFHYRVSKVTGEPLTQGTASKQLILGEAWRSGMYILKITQHNQTITRKLVKH